MGCLEAVRQGGHDEKENSSFLTFDLGTPHPLSIQCAAVSAVGLNLLLGVAGQISLGHAAFMGIGGYTSAILMIRYGIPSIVSVLAGGLLAGLFGLIIGFPALRLKGFYLAIATMALGTAVTDVADRGLTNVPPVNLAIYGFHKHFLLQGPSFCHLFFLGRRRWCHVCLFHICTQTCSDLACPLSFVGPCARFRPVGHCPQTIWYKTGSHGWSPLRCHPHLSCAVPASRTL